MEVWKKLIPIGKSLGIILDKVLLDGHEKGEEVLIDIKDYRKTQVKDKKEANKKNGKRVDKRIN